MVDEAVSSQSAESRPAAGKSYLFAKVKASPRKTALLCGLAVVLIVLVIRTATRPDSASAKVVELAAPQEPAVTVQSPPLPAAVVEPRSEDSAKIDNTIEEEDTSGTLPQRDIFAIDLSYFEQLSADQVQAEGRTAPADRKQLKLIALRARVRQFQLQSTMTGPVPAAYIDGALLREGHTYKGFQIRQINNRSVSLEKDGRVFNLRMAQE